MNLQTIDEEKFDKESRDGGYCVRALPTTKVRVVDEEKRTVELSFSSEIEVERWFGIEVLGHDSGEVQMDWLASGRAPLLLDHEWGEQIGVVESASIAADRKGRAVVRFGKGVKATEVFNDVIDGIRSSISVGYFINRMILEEAGEDNPDKFRVVDWEPFEISIVAVPADRDVGVGRSFEFGGREHQPPSIEVLKPKSKGEKTMTKPTETPEAIPAQPSAAPMVQVDVNAEREKVRKDEMQRTKAIRAVAKAHSLPELGEKGIEDGSSIAEFQDTVLRHLAETKPEAVRTVKEDDALIGLTDKEAKRFSLMRAVQAIANNAPELAPFEMEVIRATKDKFEKRGKAFEGQIALPMDVLIAGQRDLTAGGATSGAELVGTDHMAESFIDALRGRLLTAELGARFMSGLVGDVAIPKLAAGATAYWVTEGNAPTESQQTTGSVTLNPKTVGAFTDISRKLLLQSSPDAEQLVRDDLVKVLARAIDTAAYAGSGASGQPTGIKNVSGIGSVDYGAGITFDDTVDLETAVDIDNALMGSLAYVTTPTLAGAMKKTLKASGVQGYIWEGDEVNGYDAHRTSLMTAGEILFGNWEDLIIGNWGVLDLNVDTATLSTSGGVRLVALQDIDIAVRHPESFARGFT